MRANLFHVSRVSFAVLSIAACTRTSATEPPRAGFAHESGRDASAAPVPAVTATVMALPTAAILAPPVVPAPPTPAEPGCEDGLPGQSCAPGPGAVDWNCKGGCAQECIDCSAKCGDASCRQTCLATRDRCATGKCAREMKTYLAQLKNKLGCKGPGTLIEVCERLGKCFGGCDGHEGPSTNPLTPCEKRCVALHGAGCDSAVPYNANFGACGAFELPPP